MAKKKETMGKFMVSADFLDSDFMVALWAVIRQKHKGNKAKDLFGRCAAVLLVLFSNCAKHWDKAANRKGAFVACGVAEDLDQVAEAIACKVRMGEGDVMEALELFVQAKIIAQREDDVWWCPMWVSMQSPAYACELYEAVLDNLKSAKSNRGGKMTFKEQQEFIVASMCRLVSGPGTDAINEAIKQWAADYVAAHGNEATTAREWAIYCENDDVPGKWEKYCDEHPVAAKSSTGKKRRGKTVKPVDVLADDFDDDKAAPAIPTPAQPEPVQPVVAADVEPDPDQYSGMGCDDWQAQAQPETMCEFEPEEPEDWMLENADNFDAKPVPVPAPAPDPEPIQPAPDDSTDADEDGYLAALVADSNEPGVPCIAGDPAFGELA